MSVSVSNSMLVCVKQHEASAWCISTYNMFVCYSRHMKTMAIHMHVYTKQHADFIMHPQ